jgi:hypothetical protein
MLEVVAIANAIAAVTAIEWAGGMEASHKNTSWCVSSNQSIAVMVVVVLVVVVGAIAVLVLLCGSKSCGGVVAIAWADGGKYQ